MKPFNFKSWYQSPRFQKWGLFAVLAVSLGFNLSMNPEHFNNIARYEVGTPLQSYDLAQQAPAAATPKKTEVIVGGKRGNFKANVFEVEGTAFVKFEAVVATPGNCELCSAKAMPLSSSIDKLSDLQTELLSIVNADSGAAVAGSATASTSASKLCPMDAVPKQKAGELAELSEEQMSACAEKCDKSSDAMKCHQSRLIELSKFMKNSTDTDGVQKYFQKYLYTEIKSGMTAPTVREIPASSCEGTPVYYTRFGVGCQDTTALEKSQEIAKELIGQLRSQNGKLSIEALTKLEAMSFSAQTRNAQVIGNQGMTQGNMDKWNYGQQYANPYYLESQLNQTYSDLMDSVSGRSDKGNQQGFMDSLNRTLYTPVSSYLAEMQRCGMNSSNNQNNNQLPMQNGQPHVQNFQANNGSDLGGCQTFLDYRVPNLGEGLTLGQQWGPPGTPGNAAAGLHSRGQANRGTVPSDWLYLISNANGVQNTNMVNGALQPNVVAPNGAPLTGGRKSSRTGGF